MGSARLSSELHASPSQSTTSPSIPSVCLHFSHSVITGPLAFPFMMLLLTQIASKSATKPEKRTPTQQSVTQLSCTALKMRLDIGGAETGLSCCFSSPPFSSHRRQRGLGSITPIIVLYITNNADWKMRAF